MQGLARGDLYLRPSGSRAIYIFLKERLAIGATQLATLAT